jgi:arsenate reductase
MLGMKPRELLRTKEAKEAGLDDPNLSDDALIAGMVANPIVIERPIVISGGEARIGRPPESVLEIV